jgi:myo-inositol-1(or 4)-monophosphatase
MLNFAIKTAKKAGALLLKKSEEPLKIQKKGIRDLVTEADKASEALIIQTIRKKYPDHGIIAEESSKQTKSELEKLKKAPYIWIIDPLDGTTNYTIGLKQYAVSIGVFKSTKTRSSKNFDYLEGEIVMGVVYAPALKELFYAEKGKGAYLNEKRIQVSKTPKLIDAVIATGFPYKNKTVTLPYLATLLDKCRGIRRFGAASLDMCYVAKGSFDAYWEFNLKAWDIAGGAIIVEEAGGKVTDSNGNQLDLFGKDILIGTPKVQEKITKIFRKI